MNQNSKANALIQLYLYQLSTKPLQTKVITSGTISALANLTAQLLNNKSNTIDVKRILKFVIYGCLISTGVHYWYKILDQLFKTQTRSAILARVAVDQLVFAPLASVFFLFYMSLVDGNLKSFPNKLNNTLWPQLKVGWRIWPVAQLFNFAMVPPHLRVLFGNVVAYFWNVYLSTRANK